MSESRIMRKEFTQVSSGLALKLLMNEAMREIVKKSLKVK